MCTVLSKMGVEERKHLAPAVDGLLLSIVGLVMAEKGMPGAVVPVELEGLSEFSEDPLYLIDLARIGVGVVVAKDPEERHRHVGGAVYDAPSMRPPTGRVRLSWEDAPSPAVHRGVK